MDEYTIILRLFLIIMVIVVLNPQRKGVVEHPIETKKEIFASDILHVFSDFDGVQESDLSEIRMFIEVFEELKEKYGKFKLIFKDSWFFAKIFEVKSANWAEFVVKIPHIKHFNDKVLDINSRMNKEIELHQRFLKAYFQIKNKYQGVNRDILINNIEIPMIHRETNSLWLPIIFMEKLSGRTVWFNVISSIFSPIFQNKIMFDKIEKEKWSDDMVERFLYKVE